MREYGVVRWNLGATKEEVEASKPYLGQARVQLGIMKNLMALGNQQQGTRAVTLPDGTVIRSQSVMGQDTVQITPTVAVVARAQAKVQAQAQVREWSRITVLGTVYDAATGADQPWYWRDGHMTQLFPAMPCYDGRVSPNGRFIVVTEYDDAFVRVYDTHAPGAYTDYSAPGAWVSVVGVNNAGGVLIDAYDAEETWAIAEHPGVYDVTHFPVGVPTYWIGPKPVSAWDIKMVRNVSLTFSWMNLVVWEDGSLTDRYLPGGSLYTAVRVYNNDTLEYVYSDGPVRTEDAMLAYCDKLAANGFTVEHTYSIVPDPGGAQYSESEYYVVPKVWVSVPGYESLPQHIHDIDWTAYLGAGASYHVIVYKGQELSLAMNGQCARYLSTYGRGGISNTGRVVLANPAGIDAGVYDGATYSRFPMFRHGAYENYAYPFEYMYLYLYYYTTYPTESLNGSIAENGTLLWRAGGRLDETPTFWEETRVGAINDYVGLEGTSAYHMSADGRYVAGHTSSGVYYARDVQNDIVWDFKRGVLSGQTFTTCGVNTAGVALLHRYGGLDALLYDFRGDTVIAKLPPSFYALEINP